MRTSIGSIARAIALGATLVAGTACTEKVLVPQTQAVQLTIELASQVAGGSRTVTVRVRYQTASGSLVSLLDQVTTLGAGTHQLSVPVDLAKCLADVAHVGGATTCRLRVLVELRDAATGALLDSIEMSPIDASPGAAPAVATVTVAAASTITVSGIPSSLIAGQSAQPTGVVKDASGNTLARTVTWSSSNGAIATVNATTGQVTAIAPGTVQIVASSSGVTQATSLTVLAAVASISVNPSSALLTVGQTTQLIVTLRDASNNVLTGRTVTYSSSASTVASVSSSGVVAAVSAGTAIITSTSEGRSTTTSVTVNNPPLASVTPTSMGQTHTFGQSSCPQAIGTITITNTSGASVNFSANVPHASLRLTAPGGTPSSSVSGGAGAGATAQIAVTFNCASSQSVSSTVTVTVRNLANTVVETYTVAVSVPVVIP
jgi:hypothetical protein